MGAVAHSKGLILAKRTLFLAWQAAQVGGMGIFQDRGEQTEEEVWNSAYNAHDYQGSEHKAGKDGELNADYVNGRMMKLFMKWDDNEVTLPTNEVSVQYQSWAHKYPSYDALLTAAKESLQ